MLSFPAVLWKPCYPLTAGFCSIALSIVHQIPCWWTGRACSEVGCSQPGLCVWVKASTTPTLSLVHHLTPVLRLSPNPLTSRRAVHNHLHQHLILSIFLPCGTHQAILAYFTCHWFPTCVIWYIQSLQLSLIPVKILHLSPPNSQKASPPCLCLLWTTTVSALLTTTWPLLRLTLLTPCSLTGPKRNDCTGLPLQERGLSYSPTLPKSPSPPCQNPYSGPRVSS